jgi:glycopeptide antibiotics resistance protein
MAMGQVFGNPPILAALGSSPLLRFAALASVRPIVLLAVVGSILIETAQFSCSWTGCLLDDVLLNTAGAGLAALAGNRLCWRRHRVGPA